MTPDADALARSAGGDARAFDLIVRTHEARVRGFLARVAGADLADELAQRTFIQAWRKAGAFRGEAAVGSWLLGIAWTTFLMDRRSDRREARRREAVGQLAERSYAPPQDAAVDAARLLAALPPDQRAALVLGHGLGHSQSECAAILGLPLGTFKSLQARARARAQTLLGEAG
ncbi:RNA polymerase sigma factor [Sphingomonas sp.]|uniref:RNA polymerase sigma factor n=1 Tax=Sphingomonas sp. TaxID=28214 RepID=UPI002D7FA003|nr:RNA polymerase sigma factor [Sphingomonas sp.]HEU0043264.1 RNA polymerase sigma factor [Sphingomonas sp.]